MHIRANLICGLIFIILIQLVWCKHNENVRNRRQLFAAVSRDNHGRYSSENWAQQQYRRSLLNTKNRIRKRQSLDYDIDEFVDNIDNDNGNGDLITDNEQQQQLVAQQDNDLTLEDDGRYDPYRDSFNDRYDDGTYSYGYSLPNGVTRFERSLLAADYDGYVVEGFYSQPRAFGSRLRHELHCYRSDINGYQLLGVQFVTRTPLVRRGMDPNVECLNSFRR